MITSASASTTGIANGVTTVWPFGFLIPYQDNGITPAVSVTLTDTTVSPNVVTVLTPSQYAIAGVNNSAGGAVTYTPALVTGFLITIARAMAYTQGVSFPNQNFLPQSVELMGDRLELQIQQISDAVSRSVRAPISDGAIDMTLAPKASRAGMFFAFDSNGLPALTNLAGTAVISAATSLEVSLAHSGSPVTQAVLAAADSAANILGGVLVLDAHVTLTGNIALTAPYIRAAGGVITRGASTISIAGRIMAPDCVAIFDTAGSGAITLSNKNASFAWFGAKQDTTPLGATVTDNQNAWVTALAACAGGRLKVPGLSPGKAYAITTGGTVAGPTEIDFDDCAYLQHQGAGYALNYQGGGTATAIRVHFRTYGSASGAGAINFSTGTGYIEAKVHAYGYPNGEGIAFTGTTFSYRLRDCYIRNCKRWIKERAGQAHEVNHVIIDGGKYSNDSSCAGDTLGLVQLDRGNGWLVTGKPDFAQGHATPVPLFKLAGIAYVNSADTQVLNFNLGDAYIEGSYTDVLAVGINSTYPSSTQQPRDIKADFFQVANAATAQVLHVQGALGVNAYFGYQTPGNLFTYDGTSDCIAIRMQQDTGLYSINTSATFTELSSTRYLSYDNQLTDIIQHNGTLTLNTGRSIRCGTGSPEGAVVGIIGDEWVRADGGVGTTHYFKESGAGTSTGWVGK